MKARNNAHAEFPAEIRPRCLKRTETPVHAGGGTWFEGLGRSIQSERGHIMTHASGCLHGGHPISSGTRYILVAFVIVEG